MAEGFESLQVWQKAHALMLLVHREVVPHLPPEEKWDLASKAQRLLNGYIDYLKREQPGKNEPGHDIDVDHPRFDPVDLARR